MVTVWHYLAIFGLIIVAVVAIWLSGVVVPILLIVGGAIFLAVVGFLIYFFVMRKSPEESSSSAHKDALDYGVNWLKKNVYKSEEFYYREARGRTIEDILHKRIFYGFRVVKASTNSVIVFVVSKPENGKMDMWDWYDYPSPELITNPLLYVEIMIERFLRTHYYERKEKEPQPFQLYAKPPEEKPPARGEAFGE
jgi:hypothetical protein